MDKVFELVGGGSVINGLTPSCFSFDFFLQGKLDQNYLTGVDSLIMLFEKTL